MTRNRSVRSERSKLFDDRRAVFAVLLCLVLAVWFWTGSRYPDLDEKALMGGTAILEDPLGFEAVLPVSGNDPFWARVWRSTINWIATNRQGMTFGVLMAAAFLTLFRLLAGRRIDGRSANSMLGVLIGAPLGVCVNCAAPIARGMHAAGARLEMSLAAMISSPTLNVVVVTMMIALLPAYMVALKLAVSVLFLVVLLPVLSRSAFGEYERSGADIAVVGETTGRAGPGAEDIGPAESRWLTAALWVARDFGTNLLFIVRKTVPLMFLAGFLGALLVSVLPWETIAGLLPREGALRLTVATVGIALFGLTLPVPIALDVVVCAGLLAAGVAPHYVMVLLFSLGVFSIYSFFVVQEAVSFRVASVLSVALLGLSVAVGAAVFAYDRYFSDHLDEIFAAFAERTADRPVPDRSRPATAFAAPEGAAPPLDWETVDIGTSAVLVERRAFQPGSKKGATLFTLEVGDDAGLVRFDPVPLSYKMTAVYYRSYPISAGDVNGDGRPDLAFGGTGGIQLFVNLDGQRFSERRIDVPALAGRFVANAALVDLDDDGHLDLFASVYRGGNHIVYNDGSGNFEESRHHRLPASIANLAAAAAFGDLDRDGDLDIYLGNWTAGNLTALPPESSRDVILWNDGNAFTPEPMSERPGETLSVLFSDLDSDGDLDIFAGVDFSPPDVLLRGDGKGGFRVASHEEGLVPVTTFSTMSIDAVDIDNDLRPDVYMSQITGGAPGQRERLSFRTVDATCEEYADPARRDRCLRRAAVLERAIPARLRGDARHCYAIEDAAGRDECTVYAMMRRAVLARDRDLCGKIPRAWEDLAFMCTQAFLEPAGPGRTSGVSERSPISQRRNRNVLLMAQEDGRYVERAEEFGVELGGWSWNAKFADLDNDRWQDLFLVNGRVQRAERTSNMYYANQGGRRFEERAKETGLASHFVTASYVYVDLDDDGDLDIVTVSVDGPIWIYRNGTDENNAIAFEVCDETGNRFGIGTRIVVHNGGGTGSAQMRELKSGGGYVSFDPPSAHFGLAGTEEVDRVEIRWSTGETTEIATPLAAGHRYRITRRNAAAGSERVPQ